MSLLAIELNDVGIKAASATLVAKPNPAYALLIEPSVKVGEEAFKQARIYPRKINNRFWHQLQLEQMERVLGATKTHADLAYAHLMQIYKPYRETSPSVIFGVPANYTNQQLGLLLGICQRAEIRVAGLVDAALASVSHPVPGERMVVIDATQHSILVTELLVDKGLRRGRTVQIDNFGFNEFLSRWASFISDSFIKNTRFDPLHSAQSEQWLYDSIPEILQRVNAEAGSIEIASEDGEYTANIDYELFVAAVAGLYQPIVNAIVDLGDKASVTTVLMSHNTAGLSGLRTAIEHYPEFRVVSLDEQAVTRAILKDAEKFKSTSGNFSLIKQKPWQATPSLVGPPSDQAQVQEKNNERNVATHALIDNQAYVLGTNPFVIGTSLQAQQWGFQVNGVVKGVSRNHCSLASRGGQVYVEDASTYGTFVNGEKVDRTQLLQVGDRIQIGNPGIQLRLIRQVAEDA